MHTHWEDTQSRKERIRSKMILILIATEDTISDP